MGDYLKIDKNKLTETGNSNYVATDSIREKAERIQGLIENNVSFSAVVYGYRGTGKTSFVDYILKKFENDRVIIRFNATKYNGYNKFLKRFIRELYLAVNELNKSKADGVLKEIYKHTFFNISEVSKADEEKKKTVSGNISFLRELNYERVVDLSTVSAFIVSIFANFAFKGITVLSSFQTVLVLIIIAVFLAAVNLTSKRAISYAIEKSYSKEKVEKKERTEESLYDDEIAEYHVFNQLHKISKDNSLKKVIFVLDELDKLDDKDIKEIIKDLKSLVLSDDIISILVAGKNYEKYWDDEQDEADGLAGNIFSQKIYIPLADITKASDIICSLFEKEDQQKLKDNPEYINEKIIRSEGVIRNIINLVIGDIEWKDPGPMVDINPDRESITLGRTAGRDFKGINSVNERIFESFKEGQNSKTDEMYKLAYRIIRYIRENGLRYSENDKFEAMDGLQDYIASNVKHLKEQEIEDVFEDVFQTDDLSTDSLSPENMDETEASEYGIDIYDKLESMIVHKWGAKLNSEEVSRLQELYYGIFNLVLLFAGKMDLSIETLFSALYVLEIDNSSNSEKWNGFKECINDIEPMTFRTFLYSYEDAKPVLVPDDAMSEAGTYVNNEAVIRKRSGVAEALMRIYYWKVMDLRCPYTVINDRIIYKLGSWDGWDMMYSDEGTSTVTVLEVKYYMQNRTTTDTINYVFRRAGNLSKETGKKVNCVLAVFVPSPVSDVLERNTDYANYLQEKADEPDKVSYSLCYIPYDSKESFTEGIDKFTQYVNKKL